MSRIFVRHLRIKIGAHVQFLFPACMTQSCRAIGLFAVVVFFTHGADVNAKRLVSAYLANSAFSDICKFLSTVSSCGKVTKSKKTDDSIYRPLYDTMHHKLTQHKSYHRRLVKRRSSTVEPVLGTLINHHSIRRVNTRGMSGANKHVLMAALSYNLKKYLRFTRDLPQTTIMALQYIERPLVDSRFVA